MQIQSALFDILGEGERAMEVLFDIVPRASEISRNVTIQQLTQLYNGNGDGHGHVASSEHGAGSATATENLHQLRKQAMETAEYASRLRAEMEGDSTQGSTSNTTHTIKRSSDKAAIKQIKQATKAAAAALAAAKQAGAIVDEHDVGMLGYDPSMIAMEAYHDQNQMSLQDMDHDQFQQFQSNLLPEGTKEYNAPKGLPTGTEREYLDGYEMVTIPAPVKDPAHLHPRIALKDVMSKMEQKAFTGTNSLNPMQSYVFQAAFHSNENLLICAPTGEFYGSGSGSGWFVCLLVGWLLHWFGVIPSRSLVNVHVSFFPNHCRYMSGIM